MQQLPERITAVWISSLADTDLVDVEWRLHQAFAKVETEQKKILGASYQLMRGPEVLLAAWQRWSMVSSATRERGLHPRNSRVATS